MAQSEIIQLDYPFTTGTGEELKEITVRRAKVGDLRAAAKAGGESSEQEIVLVARITGLVVEDVEQLDLADYRKVQTFLSAAG